MSKPTSPAPTAPNPKIAAFVEKWQGSSGAERANKDSSLRDLCEALGVPKPDPTTGDAEKDVYVFEKDAMIAHEGGKVSTGKIDLYRGGCFILEAKQGSESGSSKIGTAKRGTGGWAIAMRDAWGQALGYAQTFDAPPPFLVVCDIGYCFDLYATFDGTRNYRDFPDAQRHRIFLADLEAHADTLRTIFTDPHRLDPSNHAAKVTREIAGHLAELARSLEGAGHAPERIATFLMRCIFTMFAEDVGLLPEGVFTRSLEREWLPTPLRFQGEVESLWKTMNAGGNLFGVGKILQFNGGLFAAPEALPLTKKQLQLLLEASASSWVDVEPTIFGTLLERALDPKERHALGAHFTPPSHVERVVRPTIEEPLREEWDVVRAEVRQLVEAGKDAAARTAVRLFHKRLCEIRVLDAACGTGNFLYVTLNILKRLESEVLSLLSDLGEKETSFELQGLTVTPAQFHGIEIKPWAKEIAELVLWIGYLQWQLRATGDSGSVREPVLQKYGNIECRDAVLAYDGTEPAIDTQGKPLTRWDGETTKESPVTGEQIPDETARVPVLRYLNPRKAEWPDVDFIVGNPPFIGNKRMRFALGDGYVEALRKAHSDVPETADLVMYWWDMAAERVRSGAVQRFGLITTNSITQTFNRKIVQRHLEATPPLHIAFAVPDHPWVDETNGAAVRVAMTVGEAGQGAGTLGTVAREIEGSDGDVAVELSAKAGIIHPDLTVGADFSSITCLRSNDRLSFMGITLIGNGFRLAVDQMNSLGWKPGGVIRPFLMGRDLVDKQEPRFVIDFFGLSDKSARETAPVFFQHVLNHVKPERDENPRRAYRDRWWLFGESREGLRRAVASLERYVVTARTAKHRVFQFIPGETLIDSNVVGIASSDSFVLGVLSSRVHRSWAFRTGATLEDRPHYTSSTVFEPFPFPTCTDSQKGNIRDLGEQLDAHRKRQQAQYPDLTITGMYNVLEKLRSGEVLTAKEKVILEQGLVSVLKQLHDDLDATVFDAYGWPTTLTDQEILERLVAFNIERAEEELRGIVRWLRPEFQNPGGKAAETQGAFSVGDESGAAAVVTSSEAPSWPKSLSERIVAVRGVFNRQPLAALDAETVVKHFSGARRKDVEAILESLSSLGLLLAFDTPAGRRWRSVASA